MLAPHPETRTGRVRKAARSLTCRGKHGVSLIVLLCVFAIIGAVYFWATNTAVRPQWVAPVMTGLWVSAGVGGAAMLYWVWREFTHFTAGAVALGDPLA